MCSFETPKPTPLLPQAVDKHGLDQTNKACAVTTTDAEPILAAPVFLSAAFFVPPLPAAANPRPVHPFYLTQPPHCALASPLRPPFPLDLRARSVRVRPLQGRADPLQGGRRSLLRGRHHPDHLQRRPQLVARQAGEHQERHGRAHPVA